MDLKNVEATKICREKDKRIRKLEHRDTNQHL